MFSEATREDMDMREALDTIKFEGILNDNRASKGIAQIIIDGGSYEDLSPAQEGVFDEYILPDLTPICEECGERLECGEIVGAYNGDFSKIYCEGCRTQMYGREKD